jgi:hypothetical protein
MVSAFAGVSEGQLDESAFFGIRRVVNRLSQKLIVRVVGAFRAACSVTVQGQLDGIQKRRLAASIDATEQHDGRGSAAPLNGRQVEHLFTRIETELVQPQLGQDHRGITVFRAVVRS